MDTMQHIFFPGEDLFDNWSCISMRNEHSVCMQERVYVYVSAAFILSGCPPTQSNLAFEAVLKDNVYK